MMNALWIVQVYYLPKSIKKTFFKDKLQKVLKRNKEKIQILIFLSYKTFMIQYLLEIKNNKLSNSNKDR